MLSRMGCSENGTMPKWLQPIVTENGLLFCSTSNSILLNTSCMLGRQTWKGHDPFTVGAVWAWFHFHCVPKYGCNVCS